MPQWTLAAPGAPVLGPCPAIMGIVNVTPDSFSDGGRDWQASLAHARGLIADGADWLDVGGESTRPGAEPVSVAAEIDRVVPVIDSLRQAGVTVPISVDTRKAAVAARAIAVGATVVNDVSAGGDPDMLPLVAEHGVGLCLMHMQGEPGTMQDDPQYDDVVGEVGRAIRVALDRARTAGVADAALIADPGIGFGKTHDHNLALLRALDDLGQDWQRPILLGLSRKRIVGQLMGGASSPVDRDVASHLLHVQLAPQVAILRVHDVAGACLARRLCLRLPSCEEPQQS